MGKIILSLIREEEIEKLKKLRKNFSIIELRLDKYPFKKSYMEKLATICENIIIKFPPKLDLLKKYDTLFSKNRFLIDLDFEFFSKINLTSVNPQNLIVSHHNFKSSDNLLKYFKEMGKTPARYLKIIGRYSSEKDFKLLEKIYKRGKKDKEIISFFMGNELAPLSRFISLKYGNPFFYTFLKDETAPGQIPLNLIARNRYEINHINEKTKFYTLIGSPVKHSLSPLIHNYIFKELNENKFYLALELKEITPEMTDVFRKFLCGISVTSPFKEKFLKFLDVKSREVEIIKSVNTILIENSEISGFNTDYSGFIKALKREAEIKKIKKALVLGAGGSAKSVIYGLKLLNIDTKIYNRTRNKAEKLANYFGIKVLNLKGHENFDLIINCTTAGSISNREEIPIHCDRLKSRYYMDLIYIPEETKFSKIMKKRGSITFNGISMLLFQAILQEKIWGIKIDDEEKIFSRLIEEVKNVL